MAVYELIAEAESHAHGVPISEIHFHEVGTMDAIVDITAVCLLMNEIAPDEVIVSVHGKRKVWCAHGVCRYRPRNCPYPQRCSYLWWTDSGRLCTPTGAALLKHFATRFGDMPVMKPQAIGYGMERKILMLPTVSPCCE